MEYNEKRTAAEIDERNNGTIAPDVSVGNAPGEASGDTIGKTGKVTVKEAEKATGEEERNTPRRVGQNKRKIDREEILRQASEPAMRAEKMVDSILHIRSAAQFLTERYVPEDKRSYAAENMPTCMQNGMRGNMADEKTRQTRPGDTNAGLNTEAHAGTSERTSMGTSAGTGTGVTMGTSGDGDAGVHTSAYTNGVAGRTAHGVSSDREIPPLAVPVDFSTLGFPEASADEPVAPDECRIIILRHAQSLGNAKGSFLGHTDLDLTEQGFVQAEMAADFLDATCIHIDKIYSSDLMRAFHTALPSARRRGLLLSTTKELREVYMGKWEGRVVAELDAEYPEEFSIGWRQHFGTCVLPEGESVPHAARRVYDFVVSRAKENLGKTVMFTSHAAAIRSFWGLATGVPFERMAEDVPFPGNASFSTMIWKSDGKGDGSLTPCAFSIDAYLGDLRQTKHS